MRPRSIAVSTATLIAAASMSPVAASAAGMNTIYVNSANTGCTDSGSGSADAPFCTVQPALDAAGPGDIVNIAAGNYAAATLTRSGTASAPILITGNAVLQNLGTVISGGAGIAGLDLSGASDVEIENLRILSNPGGDAVVDGGSDVTFTRDLFVQNTAAGVDALHVTDSAEHVTVSDSLFESPIAVDGGANGTILTTNILTNGITNVSQGGLSIAGATDTAVTSNSIAACGPGVSVTDSASGTRLENNIITATDSGGNCTSAQPYGLLVDASSASTTTSDYNDVYNGGSTVYEWAGTPYQTAAALYAVAGQAQHDDNSSTGVTVAERSPVINSADSAAVGEQTLDYRGDPRTLDPLVAPTGAGPENDYDRGAIQFEDPTTPVTQSFTSSATKVPVGGGLTLHAAMTDTWSNTLAYTFTANGTPLATGTDGDYTATFSTPGNYTVTAFATPADVPAATQRQISSITVNVVPVAPLAIKEALGSDGSVRGVTAFDVGTTDDWNITKVTFDFGDGTPVVSTTDGTHVDHVYAKTGTYNVTETVTDAAGNTQSTTSAISTAGPAAGSLTETDLGADGLWEPNLSTLSGVSGIKQSAVTAMPDGTAQAVAVTTAGTLEFAVRSADTAHAQGTWGAWTVLSQPGVTVTDASIAGMPNGTTQVIEITSTGVLKHNIRNANGTWQASGWGTPVGSTGIKQAAITAMPNGNSQLVAVTTSGVLKHNIRFANPASWQGWDAINQPGVTVTDASIAGMSDGDSQLVEVTSTGVLKHNIRLANNTWQAGGWGTPVGSADIAQASITALPGGSSEIAAITTSGTLEWDRRNTVPAWSGWYSSSIEEFLGSESVASDAGMPNSTLLTLVVDGG